MPISSSRSWCSPRQFQNSIFTIISSQERPTQQTQTSQKLTSPCQRQRRVSSTRTTHVLYISTRVNYNSSSLKQQCFKASMSHLVVNCQSIMTQRQSNYHITLLTTGTICNYTFYIILNLSHCPPHKTCHSPYPLKDSTTIKATFPNPIGTSNQKNSRCYLSCSMDQSRHGCRTLHPIRLPYV
jgi:hypothetical protein